MSEIAEQVESENVVTSQVVGSSEKIIVNELNAFADFGQYGKGPLGNINYFINEEEVTSKAVVKMIISETYRLTSENIELKKHIPQYNETAIENARLKERIDNKGKIKVTSELTSTLGGALIGAAFSATGNLVLYFLVAGILLIIVSFYTNHI